MSVLCVSLLLCPALTAPPFTAVTYAQMEALEELAEKEPARVQIIKKAAATKLIKENGAVIGVEYSHDGQTKKAYGPVVLATGESSPAEHRRRRLTYPRFCSGGYAADFSKDGLLAKYRPDLMHLPTTNGDHCTGDGQKMVLDVGGAGIDLEKVQVHPTGLVDPSEPDAKVKFLAAEALRGVGGLLLDNEGDRFADELGHRDYVTGRMWDNNKFPVRLILNGQASKEIEWHCKVSLGQPWHASWLSADTLSARPQHYVGRGLMKRFETGEEVAKEMGISVDKLRKTFDNYMEIAKDPKKDPFGKKFFSNNDWQLSAGPFHVALMTPVLHYTMGGLEIDPMSRVLDTAHKPIPGLFASGEIAGGVHGANRLGGSSLLGCVVFGRVAGDSAASYLLKSISTGQTAANRLGQVGGHLGMATTIRIDPATKKVHLEFAWDEQNATASSSSSATPAAPVRSEETSAAVQAEAAPQKEAGKPELKSYTLEEVAKHNTKDDCWVVVEGRVLNVTNFMPDHPGGPKAILLYAGRDATEEFLMLHQSSTSFSRHHRD